MRAKGRKSRPKGRVTSTPSLVTIQAFEETQLFAKLSGYVRVVHAAPRAPTKLANDSLNTACPGATDAPAEIVAGHTSRSKLVELDDELAEAWQSLLKG